MRLLYIILISIHGLIHLIGFLKAFEIAHIEQLRKPVSRQSGYFWGLSTVLFLLTAVLFYLNNDIWWMVGLLAVLTSQWLIISQWKDARFGTVANFLILVGIILGMAAWSFRHKSVELTEAVFEGHTIEPSMVTPEQAEQLPDPVQRWLNWSNIIGRKEPAVVRLHQYGTMETSPDRENEIAFTADQWFTMDSPQFIWIVEAGNPMMNFRGRDILIDGEGGMLIKAYSIYPVADASGPKITQGTLTRFLAEMIWFPWAATKPYVSWEAVNDSTAKASLRWENQGTFGYFTFDEMGRPLRFEAKRYYDRGGDATLEDWKIEMDPEGYQVFDGIMIPAKSYVSWDLEEGKWQWLEVTVEKIEYQDTGVVSNIQNNRNITESDTLNN